MNNPELWTIEMLDDDSKLVATRVDGKRILTAMCSVPPVFRTVVDPRWPVSPQWSDEAAKAEILLFRRPGGHQ
jgi:hypothetical protein